MKLVSTYVMEIFMPALSIDEGGRQAVGEGSIIYDKFPGKASPWFSATYLLVLWGQKGTSSSNEL